MSVSNITNSSPPNLATVSKSSVTMSNRLAMACNNLSPILCPKVSLVSLNRSKSKNKKAKIALFFLACRMACSTLSISKTRLGKLVRES